MKKIILGSQSPRRRELLAGLGLPFEVRVIDGISEGYPDGLSPMEIARYIAAEKAQPYAVSLDADDLLVCADTIVVVDETILGKPHDTADAQRMLRLLSGRTHQVITGVCLTTTKRQKRFAVATDVTFKQLSGEEIDYYVSHFKPFDKAGAYGIQEWIGYIGVTGIKGSYFNVMGLPVQRLYEEIQDMLYYPTGCLVDSVPRQ